MSDTQSVTEELLNLCDEGPASDEFVRGLLTRVGDKWSILTLRTLGEGPRRFTELQHAIPGISHRMMSVTLRALVVDGLVHRESFDEMPPRVEYSVTPLGETLLRPMLTLVAWANDHSDEIQRNRSQATGRL
ncbi:winged helix-turn-helix transcriptional regulator [Leifsonia sp. RAF41]|uniref:winged helix-turn-helix transcriptional regulator n=1 Tax=Leifsonia sp. RAF41 TaxID=3233056 RepID=UPI003F9D4B02